MDLKQIEFSIVEIIEASVPEELREGQAWLSKSLLDMGVDSLAMAEVIFSLEDKFEISIDQADIELPLMKKKASIACKGFAELVAKKLAETDSSGA